MATTADQLKHLQDLGFTIEQKKRQRKERSGKVGEFIDKFYRHPVTNKRYRSISEAYKATRDERPRRPVKSRSERLAAELSIGNIGRRSNIGVTDTRLRQRVPTTTDDVELISRDQFLKNIGETTPPQTPDQSPVRETSVKKSPTTGSSSVEVIAQVENSRRQSKRRMYRPSVVESVRHGRVNCPACGSGILTNSGCNSMTCKSPMHTEEFHYFCFYCKKSLAGGAPCTSEQCESNVYEEARNAYADRMGIELDEAGPSKFEFV